MANKVQPLDFEKELKKILLDYGDEAQEKAMEVLPEVAKASASKLKQSSPRGKGKNSGKYASSWTTVTQDRGKTVRVYNKKYYRLTHLLEHGHLNRDGSRTKAQPHIAPAEETAGSQLEQKIKEAIER